MKDESPTLLQIFEIKKESQKMKDQRRELNKLISEYGRIEHLYESAFKSIENLNQQKPLDFSKGEFQLFTDSEAVLFLADWHYGLKTDNIFNVYNVEICLQRVEKLVQEAKRCILLHKPQKLHIVLLGDAAHGSIHTSARVASEENTCEQIMHVSEIFAEVINELSKYVSETIVYATYGNHLRTVQNKKDSIHNDNMEKLIPWWLKQRLAYRQDIKVEDTGFYEFIILDVCDYNICCTHGDLDKVKDFGLVANTLFSKRYGCPIHYTVTADKHHLEEFESFGIDSILVRSLCGTDDYANTYRLYSVPGQTLLFFRPNYGRDATYHIRLD